MVTQTDFGQNISTQDNLNGYFIWFQCHLQRHGQHSCLHYMVIGIAVCLNNTHLHCTITIRMLTPKNNYHNNTATNSKNKIFNHNHFAMQPFARHETLLLSTILTSFRLKTNKHFQHLVFFRLKKKDRQQQKEERSREENSSLLTSL